ncbi:MAG: T9SS type A sorting domain-containing protein [Flavobacterium sp.]|nr:T9SS type A sorting domain-containing protein [Flavobacterium sp.]
MKKITLLLLLLTFSFGYSQDPAVGPTDPIARNSYDVKSIYNGISNPVPPQYANEPNGTFDSFGGSNIVGDVVLADGNTVIKYTNHLYSGIRAGAGDLDVTSMTILHIDVYSPDFTSFRIKLEAVNGTNLELDVPGAHTQNAWNSYDLDLSTYVGVDLAHLKWIVPVTYNPPGRTLYLDNVYFFRPPTAGPSPTFNPWSIPDALTGAPDFAIPPASSNSNGAIIYTSSNTSVATIIGNNTIHVVGPGVSTFTASQAASPPYLAGSTTTTFTVSNPIPAAPTPPARPAADVKSIFSDAYAPIAVLGYAGSGDDNTYNTSWCPGNTTLVQLFGNNTNKVTDLGCEGVAFLSARFDATSFTYFHMDIYTDTPTQDKSFVVKFSNWNNGNAEANAILYNVTNANFLTSPNPGSWISLDIPLSSFSIAGGGSADRNDLAQFIISSDLGTVYYDNLYLHKNTVLGNTTFEQNKVKMFPNPTKNILNIEAISNLEKVAVYNMLGQEVIKTAPNSNATVLDVSNLQAGIYIVKTTIDGNVSSSKFIKE